MAQTATWITAGVGDFTVAGNWTGGVPSSTTSAIIANGFSGTPTTATINNGEIGSVFNLQVSALTYNPNNVLEINSGGELSVFGTTISDEGSINLAAGPSNATLVLNSNVSLTGPNSTYVVTLSTTGAGNAVIESSNGSTLTNSTGIQGAGIIGNSALAVTNNATINANVTGQTLTLNGTGLIANGGVLEASNGGTLLITNGAVVANYGITQASYTGAAITLSGGAVFKGGSLRALYGATMGTVGTATLDGSTAGKLTVTGNYMTGGGSTTNLLGTIVNNGLMQVDGTAGTAALSLNGNTTLQGSGGVILNAVIGGGNAIIEQTGSTAATLTNQSIIQGAGDIGDGGLALVNSGTINAISAGLVLRLNGTGGVANTGLIEATNGGVLQISGTTVNNSGGNITSGGTGSIVDLTDNGTIQGGTLNNTAGGTMYTIGTGTLDGSTHGALTIKGTYSTGDGATTGVVGTFVNNGTMQLVGNATLSLNGNTTLQGPGTVLLQGGLIQQTSTAYVTVATLTNQSTIQGAGIIGNRGGDYLAVTNSGTINANSAGQTLYLDGAGGTTNTGLLEASNGGTMEFDFTAINNAGGNITASGPSGTVIFNDADIRGGTLNNVGGGTMEAFNNATLDGTTNGALTLNGTLWIAEPSVAIGTIINNGDLRIQGDSGDAGELYLGNTVLQGAGTVTLAKGAPGGDSSVPAQSSYLLGTQLENVSNTIQGAGNMSFTTLINDTGGTINANSSGQTLLINSSGIANAGLIEASNGGTLAMQGTTVTNSGGNITASGPLSTVQFQNSTIQGGTLNNTGGGTMETVGTATLDGSTNGALTLNGTYLTGAGNTTNLLGTIVNNGNLQVDSGSVYAQGAGLSFTGNTTLLGGGTVTLTGSNNNAGLFENSGDSATDGLTNFNTIQGEGGIAVNVLNNAGTINANSSVADQGLNIVHLSDYGQPVPVLTVNNYGLMEATNLGALSVDGGTLGLSMTNSGTIAAFNSGQVQVSMLAFTNTGAITAHDNSSVIIASPTFYNMGSIDAQDTSTVLLDFSTGIGTPGTLTNSGTIFTHNNSTLQFIGGTLVNSGLVQSFDSGTLVLGNSDTYAGFGGTAVVNNGNIYSSGNSTLVFGNTQYVVLQGYASVVPVTNTGTIEAYDSSTTQFTYTTVNNAGGNITASGPSSTVQFQNTTVQGGTLNNTGGGTMETVGAATLDGSTSGALTLNGTYLTGAGNTTNLLGTIINNGNLTVDGSAGAAALSLNGNTTLQGNGSVTLNSSSGAVIQAGALGSGATLDNVGNTIQGAGVIGNGTAMNLINEAGGTLLADEPGKTLLINNNGNVTNNGTMQVNFESTMRVTGNLTNFSGNTLTGGTYSVQGFGGGVGTLMIDSFGNHAGGEIVNNAANIVLNGTSANALLVDAGGNNALAPLAANLAGGSLILEGGYNFQTAGNLSNAGALHVGGSGSVLNVGSGGTGTYTQTSGSVTIDSGGTLDAGTVQFKGGSIQNDGTIDPVNFQVSGATLSGTGTIDGNLTNDGTVILGDSATSPGTLTVTGNYIQNSDGTLLEVIGAGNSGLLSVTGDVGLDGTLDINLFGGFTPTNGATFELMGYTGAESGIFSTITGSDAGFWSVLLQNNQVDLTYNSSTSNSSVPETGSTLLLLGAGLAGLALFGRRNRLPLLKPAR